jgi:hypothetical protein
MTKRSSAAPGSHGQTRSAKRAALFASPLAGLALAMALTCLAPDASAAAWVQKAQIGRLVVHDWGTAVFVVMPAAASPGESCNPTATTMVIQRTHPLFKELYAAALLAQSTRATIGGYTYGCDPNLYNLPILQRIDILSDPNVTYP